MLGILALQVSYTNMHLMAATETVLFGEIFAGDGQRGDTAARVGHQMLEDWVRSVSYTHLTLPTKRIV